MDITKSKLSVSDRLLDGLFIKATRDKDKMFKFGFRNVVVFRSSVDMGLPRTPGSAICLAMV